MHQNLKVWRLGMDLVEQVYRLTEQLPPSELYGLCAQMCRSAVSVPSNIAEGAGRTGKAEFKRFLSIARGSLSELETQLLLSQRLGYIPNIDAPMALVARIFNLLAGLQKSLG